MSDHEPGFWLWMNEAQARAVVARDPEMLEQVVEMCRCMVDWEYQHAKNEAARAARGFEDRTNPRKRAVR